MAEPDRARIRRIRPDRDMCLRHETGKAAPEPERVIALAGIDQPSQREGDSTVFNRLEISERGGLVRRFTVVPPNGSSMRGATTAEIASIVSRIE